MMVLHYQRPTDHYKAPISNYSLYEIEITDFNFPPIDLFVPFNKVQLEKSPHNYPFKIPIRVIMKRN